MDFIGIAGWLLILAAIADIFLTVMYVGSGFGLLSPLIGKRGWILFRLVAPIFGRFRRSFLSLIGPILLIVIASTWSLLLAVGFALVYWPELGVSLQKSQGATPTGFLTALYYSGFSLTTLGIGDIAPNATYSRLLTVLEAGLGFSFFTLTITYIVSVYSALQRRNTLASILEHKTAGTGNAALLVADLTPGADISQGGQDLMDLACRAADLLESHKFYSVLHYFHFLQNRYSLPRMALTLMDTASLLQTLPLSGYEKLRPSVTQLKTVGDNLLVHLIDTSHSLRQKYNPQPEEIEDWRRHFRKVVQTLLDRGGHLPSDLREAEENYIGLRREWFPFIRQFAEFLGYRLEEVLPKE